METNTENKQVAVIAPDPEVSEQKRIAWGNLGVTIYQEDIKLQLRASAAISRLKTPSTMEEVVNAEKILKEVKAEANAICIYRKSITGPVDQRMAELMAPEKSFAEPVAKVEQAIIKIKKADLEKRNAVAAKEDALRKCREFLQTQRNNTDAAFKNKIIEKVAKVYTHALENITLTELPVFIETIALTRLKDADFTLEKFPENPFTVVTPDEYAALCKEILAFDPKSYLATYENDIRSKFSDYEVALNNKKTALSMTVKEAEKKSAAVQTEKANADVAAKLGSLAISPETINATGAKALKQVYKVQMEENLENMITILTAFTLHIDLCLPKTQTKKWFSFTPDQAALALSKVKNDDETFNPAGIIFITVDKL